MNLFENPDYYVKEKYDQLSYEDQKEHFLRIRRWLPELPESVKYNQDKFTKNIINRIEQVCAYACSGHIPAQDYMGYIYKRGFGSIFPINYKRALEWNIIAASNGSKVAPQKMRAFMNPAIDMIMASKRWGQIIKYNDLNLSNYYWFLSQYVSEVLYKDLELDAKEMAKKELIEEDTNERRIRIFFDRYRDRSVKKAIEILVNELPEDMPVEDTDGYGEDLLKNADGSDPNAFAPIDIEDI